MNEKFKLLALQATLGTADFDAGSYYVATPDRMQRFAELIVRECIRTIQMGITRDGHNTEKYLRSMKHLKDIKEHFGVEE